MKLAKWDPFQELEDIFSAYGKSLKWRNKGNHQEIMATGDWSPQVDIAETQKDFTIKAEVPGIKKEDIKIAIDNGVLSIRGERKQEKEEKDKKFHRIERSYGSFIRSFTLPENVDETKIEAEFKDGMLKLQIPKTEESKPKSIEVKIK